MSVPAAQLIGMLATIAFRAILANDSVTRTKRDPRTRVVSYTFVY